MYRLIEISLTKQLLLYSLRFIAFSDRIGRFMNEESKGTKSEAVVTQFKIISWHLFGLTAETHEKS